MNTQIVELIKKSLIKRVSIISIYLKVMTTYGDHAEMRTITKTIYENKKFSFMGNQNDKKDVQSLIENLAVAPESDIFDTFDPFGEESRHHAHTMQVATLIARCSISEVVEQFGDLILSGRIVQGYGVWDDEFPEEEDEDIVQWNEIELMYGECITVTEKGRVPVARLILQLRKVADDQVIIYQYFERAW